jgi:hypothetical protein
LELRLICGHNVPEEGDTADREEELVGLEEEIRRQQLARRAPAQPPDPNSPESKFQQRCQEFVTLMRRHGVPPTDPFFSVTIDYSKPGFLSPKARKILRYVDDFWNLGYCITHEYTAGITMSGTPILVVAPVYISGKVPDIEKDLRDGGRWKVDIDNVTRQRLPRKNAKTYIQETSRKPWGSGQFSEEGLADAFIQLTARDK